MKFTFEGKGVSPEIRVKPKQSISMVIEGDSEVVFERTRSEGATWERLAKVEGEKTKRFINPDKKYSYRFRCVKFNNSCVVSDKED